MQVPSRITGAFIVTRYLDNRVRLEDPVKKSIDVISYFIFEGFLLQVFDEKLVDKILEAINTEKKLFIDFDKLSIKSIVKKDVSFTKSMNKYFSPTYLTQVFDGTLIEE